ncbi:MAG: flagellar biosynthetic protein FliO [Nitrosomonadales bacterium]|nr:flagellar biosynthetic protein FliO [Nitrosomonadales bacterium]
MRKLILLAAALSTPLLATAETARPAYVPPAPAAISTGSVLQVILSLLLVLAAIMLVAWILKRINLPQQGSRNLLKVISGVAVGQRERIVLIEVEDTWLVVGVAPGSVRTLHTLPKSAYSAEEAAELAGDGNKFKLWLKQVMERRDAA